VTGASKPAEETVHFDNGRIKYSGFMLHGDMHGAWSWYRTDGYDRAGNVVKETNPREESLS
jgi:hypothetical protein